jgi:glycerate kinase
LRVLVAPDSLGGWLSATELCTRVQASIGGLPDLDLVLHPMADGGEGSLAVMRHHCSGPISEAWLSGPLGEQRRVQSLGLGEARFLESALVIGLPSGHGSGEPMRGSTRGLGEWILGSQSSLIIGLGGSSTVDGGIGMLRALGLEVLDARGEPVPPGARGLLHVAQTRGELPTLPGMEIWCDVRSPLEECVHRYGPQKGLAEDQLDELRAGMLRWGQVLATWSSECGRGGLSPGLPGGGAAGGLGFALAAMGAQLRPGVEAIGTRTGLKARLAEADWVIGAEGQLDQSSFEGKPMGELIGWSREADCRVLALVGRAVHTPPPPEGPDQIIEIGREPDLEEALRRALSKLPTSMGWEMRTEKC